MSTLDTVGTLYRRKRPVYIVINVELKSAHIFSSATDIADMIGRTTKTVYNWTKNRHYYYDRKTGYQIFKGAQIHKASGFRGKPNNLQPIGSQTNIQVK